MKHHLPVFPSSLRRCAPSPRSLYAVLGLLLQTGISWGSIPASMAVEGDRAVEATTAETVAEPTASADAPGQYVLEFNRSPLVGNRLRLESIYDEARLQFTRPRNWEAKSAKVLLKFRHSPALYATRSSLTVLVNGTSIGSVPLNQKQGEVGSAVFEIPTRLLQDYNEVVIAALQNNSPTCTQDPFDPTLWSEILPDSKLVFDFEPQPIALDFKQYPYPIFDVLSLEPNQVAYLKPNTLDEAWLTPASRLQTALGRIADYRPLETRLVAALDQVTRQERLIIIGTPETQPALASLDLPIDLKEGQLQDEQGQVLPADVGVLALTKTSQGVPVLVATGNSAAAVAKAAQFLVQTQDEQIGTGQAVLVRELTEVASPPPREWPNYIPSQDSFQLADLQTSARQPFEDVTVRGSHAPALEFNFRALPDDQFLRGNRMVLDYSYGPQINPLTSLIEVQLDGVAIGGERLRSVDGATHKTLKLELPEDQIRPDSKLQVNFRLDPRERRSCSRVTDQQLWGTVHAETQFHLKREIGAWLPDLKLLRSGFPFTAPQDLSTTAIAVPDDPSDTDIRLLLELSERLGRLSKAESVEFDVYRASQLPETVRQDHHLIGIGPQEQFPLPDVLEAEGFKLGQASRQWRQSQIQTLPDTEGMVKQLVSPWNRDRMVLALSGQTRAGLEQVQQLISQDPLFYQIAGDTVLISANEPDPSPYDPNAYNITVLQQASQISVTPPKRSGQVLGLIQRHWLFLTAGSLIATLVLYGVGQQYLRRFSQPE